MSRVLNNSLSPLVKSHEELSEPTPQTQTMPLSECRLLQDAELHSLRMSAV